MGILILIILIVSLTTQACQVPSNKGLLHPSEMLLIIHHFTTIVKSFCEGPSTWVPQSTPPVSYYNLTTQLCQVLFNKGLFTPLSFPYGIFNYNSTTKLCQVLFRGCCFLEAVLKIML